MQNNQIKYKKTEVNRNMGDWEVAPIGEYFDVTTGKNLARADRHKIGEYEIVGANGNIGYTNSYLVDGEFVVTGRVGTLGEIYYRKGKFWPSDNLLLIRGEKQSAKYLYYFLKTVDFRSLNVGSTQPLITQTSIKNLEVMFPPVCEQQKIAEVLGALDDKIELNKKMNKTLESISQAIFKNWFLGGDKHFKLGKLSDIANVMTGKRPNNRSEVKTGEYDIPIIGAGSIMGYTDEALFQDEDLIITGRVGTLGVLQRTYESCWTSDNALVTLSNYPNFTYQLMKSIDFESLNRGSTQPLITQTDLQNYPVITPPYSQIEKYEDIAQSFSEKMQSNLKEIETLSQIRDSFLPRLMCGKLRVG